MFARCVVLGGLIVIAQALHAQAEAPVPGPEARTELIRQMTELSTPSRIYWVQASAASTESQAEQIRSELLRGGYSPVCVYPSATGPTVRVGEFSIYMDAFLLWEDLRAAYPNARVRYNSLAEEAAAGRHWRFIPLQAPAGPRELFALSRRPLRATGPLRFNGESCALYRGETITDERQLAEAWEIEATGVQLSRELAAARDPRAGEAAFTVAAIRRQTGDFQGARAAALPVATAAVIAPPQARYDSMWLLAYTYHDMSWRRTAYRALREIEAACNDPRDAARAGMELTAMALELARSESGQFSDCRRCCLRLLEEMGSSDDPEVMQRVATSALIALESLRFERRHAELADVADTYLACYGPADFRQQHATASLFAAESLQALGRWDEALMAYRRAIDLYEGESEIWPHMDHLPRAHFRVWEVLRRMQAPPDQIARAAHALLVAFPESSYSIHVGIEAQQEPSWGEGIPGPALTEEQIRAMTPAHSESDSPASGRPEVQQ